MNTEIGKNSIQIYSYKQELQLTHNQIQEKINAETEHKFPIILRNDTDDILRYVFFEFTKITTKEEYDDVLWYDVNVKRDTLDSDPLILHHNVCFSKKGFLIITGMQYRNILLKYMTNLLHPKKFIFEPKYFTKKETQDFTKKILKQDVNRMYRPRFHFSNKYRKREFNDFIVGEYECATDDSEYSKMMEKCFYFEPIFKITDINGDEIETKLKVNHAGRFYSSHSLSFEQWIRFIKTYLSWCL